MIDKNTVLQLVNEALEDSESFLVDIQIKPGNIIIVEIDNDEGVFIEECMLISKHVESNLDREIEDFELEVGSAGVTSPFKIIRQYIKNIGNEVEVLTKTGQKLSGILKEANGDDFVISVTKKVKAENSKRKMEVEENKTFKYDEVKYTKYLIRFK